MNETYNKMKYYIEAEGIKPEIYYHYTSLDALFNIIKNQSLRLTNLSSSNDLKELSYDYKKFIKDIEKLIEEETNDKKKKILELYLQSINENICDFKKRCNSKQDIYALCLTTKRDNLTHWDRYANNCKGVCIAINMSAFDVYAKRMNNMIFGKNLISHGRVLYESSQRRKIIKNQIFGYLNYLLQDSKLSEWINLSILKNNAYKYCIPIYFGNRIFSKNASFVDEDEIRMYYQENTIKESIELLNSMKNEISNLLYRNTKKSYLEMIENYNLKKINYDLSRYGIRSYIDLTLKEIWGSGLITEIILGPLCIQNKKELKKFINEFGLKGTKITVSNVPIR